ncbi:MAG: TfoX/Sxy family DNA transformation protein [Gammaproteobacteria bacterium]
MNTNSQKVENLINIGHKIAGRLNDVGIFTEADLEQHGAASAHHLIKKKYPNEILPVCYYLYSFEGALTDTHWNEIPEKTKIKLLEKIK